IHNIVIAPSFLVVEKLNQELKNRGCNLMSDGRPIISLSARDLLDLVLSIDKNCLLIPAHIWTSWFSLFGSKSGYDSIEECFGNLSKYIYAIETGLSSTPAMNWQIKDLDSRRILSFSDAHSPANLGREATVLEIEKLGYKEIKEAITGIGGKIANTVEFYPEEGKYYYTGHRNCGIKQTPEETEKLGTTCPVCGKPLTVGVMHRVMQLSSHKEQSTENSLRARSEASKVHRDNFGVRWIEKESRPPYVSLVPLREIIAEVKGVGKLAKGVEEEYQKLITVLGSELSILLKVKTEEISKAGGEKLAEGIAKVRQGDICINPGFDGEYGMVKIWSDKKDAIAKEKNEQTSLFVN
ncbi:DNA helicase UvrD, partial [Candidatus Shapirobacteria bacterium CG03_land_8_20_14_0_80_39_12]